MPCAHIINYNPDLSLFESVPAWEFREHAQDIIDVSWNDASLDPKKQNHLLSCSFDGRVILWNLQIENNLPVQIFEHPDVPSCISFAPGFQETFVSGCLDGAIRLWSVKKKEKPLSAEITHINEKIASLCFSPEGRWLVVGLATVGLFVLYEHYDGSSINYKSRIDCRNKTGSFSSGRKIAGITFLNSNEFLVATNDSSVRLFSV